MISYVLIYATKLDFYCFIINHNMFMFQKKKKINQLRIFILSESDNRKWKKKKQISFHNQHLIKNNNLIVKQKHVAVIDGS